MQHHQKSKVIQAINLLNEIVGGTNKSSSTVSFNIMPDVDNQIAKCTKLANALQEQIKQLNNAYVESVQFMKKFIVYSSLCKKYNGDTQQRLKDKFMSYSKLTEQVEKNINFVPHARAIRELISATFWVFTNAPQFIFKGNIEAADFNALKFKTKKVMPHNQWYNTLLESVKMIESFTKQNYPMGLSFNNNGTGNWDDLLSGSIKVSEKVNVQKAHPQKPHHIEPKQQIKKLPKKELVGLNWNISNYQDQQIIINENQVSMKNGIFVENCNKCVVKVLGKFKSILINKCDHISVLVFNCISGVQIMNCTSLNIQIKEQSPSISIDKSAKVRVLLNGKNMSCDIVSSKVTELNISYTKQDGNEAKDYMIAQQLITKWNQHSNKFQTKIYDQFM